jgi:hypothetical protein
LSLLHLKVCDTGHFSVFGDHALNDVVNLVLLSDVLRLGFSFKILAIGDLHLDLLLVVDAIVDAGSFRLSLDLILDLFGPKHDPVDLGVLLLFEYFEFE